MTFVSLELYHTKELPLKSLLGGIVSVILRASCGLRVAELTGNHTNRTTKSMVGLGMRLEPSVVELWP